MTNTGVIIPIRKSSIIQDDIKIKNMTISIMQIK